MAATELTKADFQSDQETRWCPGCGDYAVLAAVQGFFPELGIPPERIVFVSGIGCAGRFAYYMDTYGMHGIHGRGPALATGLAAARDDLSIWVVTGDGDALSIGGNHLIHALRRNVPVKILLFNNQIYGLTKGQASPTSELGKVTKSTPFGSIDAPFNPVSRWRSGAEATFVARTIDTDKQHLPAVLRAAAAHEGAALIEIYQNCPVFNDGAFDALRDKQQGRGQPDSAWSTASRSASASTARTASPAAPTASCGSRPSPRSARTRWSCTTRTATTRRWRSRSRGCRRRRTGRRRSASSATSRARSPARSSRRARAGAGGRRRRGAGRRARRRGHVDRLLNRGSANGPLPAVASPGSTSGRRPSSSRRPSGAWRRR